MRIISRENKRITVITENGTQLVCQPVRQLPVQDLLFRIGLSGDAIEGRDPEQIQNAIASGSTNEKMESAEAAMALFNYCMAYGVETSPPPEAVEELEAMRLADKNPRALRVRWLNYMVLEDAEEAGLLAGLIMTLTFRGDEIQNSGPSTETP